MQLWTDYEGVTLDGAYPLQKLLMPEGRSAFYSTAGPNGELTVVRLIECHFDEEEILARWRSVQALHHPNFLKFEHFGQTEMDGSAVVYAVLEKVDANLAEVLDRGSLPIEDVAQLGMSLVAALDVLHTHGFIHEHVEPRNIFALNDTVKLRSDCIREAPEGEEGRAAKHQDVRDLVTVLLKALTQQESLDGIPDSTLPKPFNQIIHKGLAGTWGLEEIGAVLDGHFGAKPPATPDLVSATPAGAAKTLVPPHAQLPLPDERLNTESLRANTRKATRDEDHSVSLRARWLGIAGAGALLVILCIWVFAHTGHGERHKTAQAAATSSSQGSAPQMSAVPAPQPGAETLPRLSPTVPALPHAGWRVITFTYNRRTDAENKVASLTHSHPALAPAVFTPSGHAPYLVSIGGVMDQRAAQALARRSRSLGLPRDTFARNYSR